MDLNTRIRSELDEGRTIDEIVADLVAKGMSEPNARRIVEKAFLLPPAPAPSEIVRPPAPVRSGKSEGVNGIVFGAFLISVGATVTALSFKLAEPGGKATIAYGAILVGLVVLVRGLRQFDPASSSFPLVGLVVALLVPGLGGGVFYELNRPATEEERARLAEFEQLDEQRARERAEEEKRKKDEAAGLQVVKERLGKDAEAIEAQVKLVSPSALDRCAGARYVAEKRVLGSIGELMKLAKEDPESEVRKCAAEALEVLNRR